MKKLLYLLPAILFVFACDSATQSTVDPDFEFIPIGTDDGWTYYDTSTGQKAEGASFYYDATYFFEGIALVTVGADSLQYIGRDFKPINGEVYASATSFSEGYAFAAKSLGHIVCIDNKGKEVFQLKNASTAAPFQSGISIFTTSDNGYGVIDTGGNVLVKPGKFNSVESSMTEGIIKVENDDVHFALADTKGNLITPFDYELIVDLVPGLFEMGQYDESSEETFFGVIDSKGNEILPARFSGIEYMGDGIYSVWAFDPEIDGYSISLVNSRGEPLTPQTFSYVGTFGDYSVANASEKGVSESRWGFIDKKGGWVVSPKFDSLGSLDQNGVAIAYSSDKAGLVNEKGEYTVAPKYDFIDHYGADVYGVFTDLGEELLPGIINSKGEKVFSLSPGMAITPPLPSALAQDLYIDADEIIAKMVEDVNRLAIKDLTASGYGKAFRKKNLFEGEDIVPLALSLHKDYIAIYYAEVDYNSRSIKSVAVEFSLNDDGCTGKEKIDYDFESDVFGYGYGSLQRNHRIIYKRLAEALGADCDLDYYGDVVGDNTFEPRGMPGCSGRIDTDMTVTVTKPGGFK